jgi:DNA-binding response OmpR family regulator
MSVLAGRRVLIVDDEPEQADALAWLLREEGIDASTEMVPAVALTRATSDPPDAIIVNVKMPQMSGTALLAAVRQRHPSLPALVMSGFDPRDRQLAAVLRWDRVLYLGKPVRMAEVLDALGHVLGTEPGPA